MLHSKCQKTNSFDLPQKSWLNGWLPSFPFLGGAFEASILRQPGNQAPR